MNPIGTTATATYYRATDDDVRTVRALLRDLAKEHGRKVSVRKGSGSMRGTIGVYGDVHGDSPEFRILVCEMLKAAGFEGCHWYAGHTLDQQIDLAREWGHNLVNVSIVRCVRY